MCYSLRFGVIGVFLEGRFLNNVRVFLFARPKFRIPVYFYLVIDLFCSHWARNGPQKKKSRGKSHRNPTWTSVTHWQPCLGEGELAPRHCDAKCRAWEDGFSAVSLPVWDCYTYALRNCGQYHSSQNSHFGGETVPLSKTPVRILHTYLFLSLQSWRVWGCYSPGRLDCY